MLVTGFAQATYMQHCFECATSYDAKTVLAELHKLENGGHVYDIKLVDDKNVFAIIRSSIFDTLLYRLERAGLPAVREVQSLDGEYIEIKED